MQNCRDSRETVSFAHSSVDISPTSVELKDESLFILWPDGHQSVIPLNTIEERGKSRYP